MLDAPEPMLGVLDSDASHDSMNFVAFFEEQFGEVGAVLSGDSADQCLLSHSLSPSRSLDTVFILPVTQHKIVFEHQSIKAGAPECLEGIVRRANNRLLNIERSIEENRNSGYR